MFAIRDEIVTRIQTAAAADGKTLTVRGVVKPMPELEAAEFGGFLVEVARVGVRRERDTRSGWRVNYIVQVVLRRKQTNTNPSQIVALENEFADLADWLQRKLMGIEFTGPYALESIDEGLTEDLEYIRMQRVVNDHHLQRGHVC